MKMPYLIAEIGINHNGDMQIVKKLIDATFACNWDCVKFQKRTPELCVPEHQKNIMKDTPWGTMTYLEYKKRMELSGRDYAKIDYYCRQKPVDWSASVWDIPSLKFLMNYDVPFIKIPSAMITNIKLLEAVAETGKKIILSTGMSTLEEIDRAVSILYEKITIVGERITLMHTNSSYPSPYDELNLKVIDTLKERYPYCDIGYSGHEYGLEPTVIAASMGVSVIERHITLDHNMWGTDQKSSLEIEAMWLLKSRIEVAIQCVGTNQKVVTDSEKAIKNKLRG